MRTYTYTVVLLQAKFQAWAHGYKIRKGSATLSMAYAGAHMGSLILAGLNGRRRTECAYVMSDITDLSYFTSKVVFGEKGAPRWSLSAN